MTPRPSLATAARLSDVEKAEQVFRDLINSRRRHREIFAERSRFSQLCAALDVIGDAELAIKAFAVSYTREPGETYLRNWGVLQAFVQQQDAVLDASKALRVAWKLPEQARIVREIRNRTSGHPTNSFTEPKFNHVVRITASTTGFVLMGWDSTGAQCSKTEVSTAELLDLQRAVILDGLNTIIHEEVKRESTHRARFRAEKLAPPFQRVLAELGPALDSAEGVAESADALLQQVQVVRSGLERRGEFFEDVLDDHEIGLCVLLRRPASSALATGAPTRDAWFVQVRRGLEDLSQILSEIDEEYDRPVLGIAGAVGFEGELGKHA